MKPDKGLGPLKGEWCEFPRPLCEKESVDMIPLCPRAASAVPDRLPSDLGLRMALDVRCQRQVGYNRGCNCTWGWSKHGCNPPDEVVLLFGPMTENGPNRGNQQAGHPWARLQVGQLWLVPLSPFFVT